MSSPQHIGSTAPFANAAREYISKGWGVVPLPPNSKRVPPTGFTGRKNKGRFATEMDLQRWFNATSDDLNEETGRRRIPWAKGNIAVHPGQEIYVHGGVYEFIGIDVDDYGEKNGWAELKRLEKELGSLPDTWISSARSDLRSGIRWFLVPFGFEYVGKPGESIEIVQHVHRYGVVFPSWHPETKSQYWWYEPGQLPNARAMAQEIPAVETLAVLPQKWFEALQKGVRQTGLDAIDEDSSSAELKRWVANNLAHEGKACKLVVNTYKKWAREFEAGGDHHDPLVAGHWNMVCLASEGHPGAIKAIALMEKLWMKRLEEEGDSGERTLWIARLELMRSREGALRKIKAQIEAQTRELEVDDPCTKPKAVSGNGVGGNNTPPPSGPRDLGLGSGDDGLPPQGTQVESPAKPSANADWLLERWEAMGKPLITKLGEFYQYNGRHWERRSEVELFTQLYRIFDRCIYQRVVQGNPTPAPFDPDDTKLRKLLHALQSKAPNHDEQKENTWFDGRETVVVPCSNGLVVVEDKQLMSHTKEYFCTYVLHTDYDSKARCPQTDDFLMHLAGNDKESARLLYQWMGYVVAGNNKYQKGLIVKGKSGCGKGVYSRLLDKIVGKDNYAGFKVADFKNNTFAKEPLVGKSLVVFSDNRSDFTNALFVDLVLEVIGQDATTIRMPYARKSFSVYLPCRFMILTNLMPSVSDDSGAFVRRFVAVDCTEDPPTRVSDYEDVLYRELPGIINRMLTGLEQLKVQDGFVQPKRAAWILDAVRETSSLEHEFVTDRCTTGPIGDLFRVERDKLYTEYLQYCSVAQQKPLPKKGFCESLVALGGIELHKRGTRDQGQRWFIEGIRLNKARSKLLSVDDEDDSSDSEEEGK